MATDFLCTKAIRINAPKSKVWEALTNPELIKKYFFGTTAVSDWKKGSSLIFKGEWEGKAYEDKGHILEIEQNIFLKYSYWSSFSGTADIPENYHNITYSLGEESGETELIVTQDGSKTTEAREHSEKNWGMVLDGLKKLLEG